MEVGVVLIALAIVFLTSLLISALGTGTFFSLLSISTVLAALFFYSGATNNVLRKRLVGR